MTTRPYGVSIIDRTKAGAGSVIGQTRPTLLTEAESDYVAAAGSKPGASGGAGTTVIRPK